MRVSDLFRHASYALLVFSLTPCAARAETAGSPVRMQVLRQTEGPADSPLEQPTDAAVGRDGSVYVMDGVNSRVAVFDGKGRLLFSFGSRGRGAGEFSMPVGIDVSPDGNVIVADTGNHRIQVFSREGSFLWSFPLQSGPRGDPTDVCAQETGDVFYVCDNDNHQVHAYTPRGESLQILGKRGEDLGAFRYPATVTLDRKNNVYVVDALNARVQVFDSQGRVLRQISEWGNSPGKLLRPKGVAVDEDGRVFVSDSQTGRVQVFSSQGAYVGFVADDTGEVLSFVTPTNIVFDDDGRFYVVETRANRIRVLRIIGS